MLNKFFFILLLGALLSISVTAQELSATVTIQSNKVDNQVDPKLFSQLQIQLRDFINQRKLTVVFISLLSRWFLLVCSMPN
jgi:hypothetical protein